MSQGSLLGQAHIKLLEKHNKMSLVIALKTFFFNTPKTFFEITLSVLHIKQVKKR